MRTTTRYAAVGATAGFLISALVLILFPHFFSHVYELPIPAVLVAALSAVIGTCVAVVRIIMRRPARDALPGRRLGLVFAASLLLSAGLYALRTPARNWKVSPKLLVLCIDGGTWKVMDPLIASGRLPNLERIRREGTSGVLMSTTPAFSLIAWTTIGAGVRPEKHGITSFYDTQDDLESKRIWEVFEDGGHSVGLFRWWATWPPRVKKGFVIPGLLARDSRCFPEEYGFINRFRMDEKSGHSFSTIRKMKTAWRFLRAGLRLETCLETAVELLPALRSGRFADRHIALRRAEIRLNADVYCHLLRRFRPEYTCFYDNGVDQMSHFYWKYYEPGIFGAVHPADVKRYGKAIPDYYVLNDEVIGRILEHVSDSTYVAVLSDHGFGADSTGARTLYFARGVPILADMGMDKDYYSIALGSQTYIESVYRDPAKSRAALERAVGLLNSLRTVETGKTLFKARINPEGRLLLRVSDSLCSLDEHVRTPKGIIPIEQWFTTRSLSGTHEPEGIFLFRGAPFKKGHSGETAQLVDIAPTILYATGFAVSRELDGGIMWDWMTDTFRNSHEVRWVDSYGAYDPREYEVHVDEETMKKLRSLGYIR
jgi:hypothetical protein